jgi:hypothetical protein
MSAPRKPTLILLVSFAFGALLGCGGGTVTTVTTDKASTPAAPTTPATTVRPPVAKHPAARGPNNPAQQPDQQATAGCNEVPTGHPCKASTNTPSNPNDYPQRNCDTNIVANSATSCDLAETAFYEYWASSQSNIKAHSGVTNRDYELTCENQNGMIACVGSPISTSLYVSFPQAAVAAYTSSEASAFAATHTVGVTQNLGGGQSASTSVESSPTPPSSSSATDQLGSYSHEGDQSFCEEHQCIGDFESEPGYVVECADGTYSHSGGISGACSHHGGEG